MLEAFDRMYDGLMTKLCNDRSRSKNFVGAVCAPSRYRLRWTGKI